MKTHASAAWPLSLIYAVLVVYASLYPFTGWRDQGDALWAFMAAPWPQYWTGADIWINVVGYLPLGFLLSLAWLRSGRIKPALWVIGGSVAAVSALSLSMESLQQFLPSRVPSNLDWATNTLGALVGSVVAWTLERWGAIARWSRFRSRWLVRDCAGTLVLLAMWPFALLFPAPATLGLGQILERAFTVAGHALEGMSTGRWAPELVLTPLSPVAELVLVSMGLWVPVLLTYSIITAWPRRLAAMLLVTTVACLASALSAVLSFGPQHALIWATPATQTGFVLAWVLCVVCVLASERAVLALALCASLIGLALINQAPSNAYLVHNLAAWEQGRFVRFHGLSQWLGWLWPFAVVWHVFARLIRRQPTGL